MSITISLYFPFLWHYSPSLTPPFVSHYFLIPLSYAPFPFLFLLIPQSSSLHAKLPPVHLLSPVSYLFTLLTVFTSFLSLASSSIMPLPFAFLGFVCFCILSFLLKPYHIYFIFLQDLRPSSLLPPPSLLLLVPRLIPHILLSLQHAASSFLLLLYSS